jgi:hypothetical protein
VLVTLPILREPAADVIADFVTTAERTRFSGTLSVFRRAMSSSMSRAPQALGAGTVRVPVDPRLLR